VQVIANCVGFPGLNQVEVVPILKNVKNKTDAQYDFVFIKESSGEFRIGNRTMLRNLGIGLWGNILVYHFCGPKLHTKHKRATLLPIVRSLVSKR
jgi:hypothetical protein